MNEKPATSAIGSATFPNGFVARILSGSAMHNHYWIEGGTLDNYFRCIIALKTSRNVLPL
jgi:hypothetical protein